MFSFLVFLTNYPSQALHAHLPLIQRSCMHALAQCGSTPLAYKFFLFLSHNQSSTHSPTLPATIPKWEVALQRAGGIVPQYSVPSLLTPVLNLHTTVDLLFVSTSGQGVHLAVSGRSIGLPTHLPDETTGAMSGRRVYRPPVPHQINTATYLTPLLLHM